MNDAPVLSNSVVMTLANINEDDTNSAGNTVAQILATGAGGDPITDVDGDPDGIAVTGYDNTNGTWQYTTTTVMTWTNITTVNNNNALLLNPTARIRFVPNANYNGSAGNVTFHAWDQTSGSNGGTGNPSSNGGDTAFSTAIAIAELTVISVNDEPSITTNTGIMVTQNITVTITNIHLQATDIEDNDANLEYTIANELMRGSLMLNGSPLTNGGTFTQDDIDNNRLTYVYTSGASNDDSFNFTLSDSNGASIGDNFLFDR